MKSPSPVLVQVLANRRIMKMVKILDIKHVNFEVPHKKFPPFNEVKDKSWDNHSLSVYFCDHDNETSGDVVWYWSKEDGRGKDFDNHHREARNNEIPLVIELVDENLTNRCLEIVIRQIAEEDEAAKKLRIKKRLENLIDFA